MRKLASVLTNEGKHTEAIDAYKRALEVQRKAGTGNFMEAELDMGLARSYVEASRPAEALDSISRACALYTQLFGPDYPMIGEAQLQVGFILRQLDRGDESVAAMRKALAAREASHGAEHPSVVEAMVYLGDTLSWRGRPADGIPFLERAIAVGEKIKTPYPDVAAALYDLGWARLKLHQYDEARRTFERAIAHPMSGELAGELKLAKDAQRLLAADDRDAHRAELTRALAAHESSR